MPFTLPFWKHLPMASGKTSSYLHSSPSLHCIPAIPPQSSPSPTTLQSSSTVKYNMCINNSLSKSAFFQMILSMRVFYVYDFTLTVLRITSLLHLRFAFTYCATRFFSLFSSSVRSDAPATGFGACTNLPFTPHTSCYIS